MGTAKYLTMLLAFLVMHSACVKDPQDIPAGFDGDPVFGLQGLFGQAALDIRAGEDRWTMLPIPGTREGHPYYSGLFSQDGCTPDCSPSLEIGFHALSTPGQDPKAGFLATIATGNKLALGPDASADSFQVSFSTHPGLFMSGYSYWQDASGPPQTFAPSYAQAVGPNAAIGVCFESFLYTGCQYSQCLYYRPAAGDPCQAYLEATWVDSGFVRLTVRPSGTAPFSYAWYYGQSTQSILVPVQQDVSELYASVEVHDALGNSTRLSQLIRIQDGVIDPCYFPIYVQAESVPRAYDQTHAGRAVIRYVEESGAEWTSYGVDQPAGSLVAITSSEMYERSPLGGPAYKVGIQLNVLLHNRLTGEDRWLVVPDGVIALGYEE